VKTSENIKIKSLYIPSCVLHFEVNFEIFVFNLQYATFSILILTPTDILILDNILCKNLPETLKHIF